MRVSSPAWHRLRLPVLAVLAGGLAAAEAAAEAPDWSAHADRDTVHVITTDEDGARRETKVWLVVVAGQPFVRTGSTTWGTNVERDPRIALRLEKGGPEVPLVAEFVTDEALRERVSQAFREKYGLSDRLLALVRSSTPKIMRLLPRSADAGAQAP